MDALPPEILLLILSHVPRSSYPHARLTSRVLNALVGPAAFDSLPGFLEGDAARRLEGSLAGARARGVTCVWSPRCGVPAGLPVPESFLRVLFLVLAGRPWAGRGGLTLGGLAAVVERDLGEEVVREAMFRYALHLSYLYGGPGEAPSLWVLDRDAWRGKV
ncbi:hypothetical protein E4U53_005437 [Claviceps sorghi]|nr:hypothetical protein E4U53_005437 [Claviceps sorghi]